MALIQPGSESMDRSQTEAGFGIWTDYLGKVKVGAHQKVDNYFTPGQMS